MFCSFLGLSLQLLPLPISFGQCRGEELWKAQRLPTCCLPVFEWGSGVQAVLVIAVFLFHVFSLSWQHDGSGSLHDVQLSLPSSPEPEDGDQIYTVWLGIYMKDSKFSL